MVTVSYNVLTGITVITGTDIIGNVAMIATLGSLVCCRPFAASYVNTLCVTEEEKPERP